MKYNLIVILLIVLTLSLTANAQRGSKPKSGIMTGVIQRIEPESANENDLWSVWMKVRGTIYEFIVGKARISSGNKSDLKKGASIRVSYKNLELSEQDYFYYGEAQTITILKPSRK